MLLLHQQDQQNDRKEEEEEEEADDVAVNSSDTKEQEETSTAPTKDTATAGEETKEDVNDTDATPKEDEEAGMDATGRSSNEEDTDAYDSVVTTLYEMVGYNVPAEEVSRFATRISEEKGWFASEKGQALLVLARRLTAKRDEQQGAAAGRGGGGDNAEKSGQETSDFAFVRSDSRCRTGSKEVHNAEGGGIIPGGDDDTTLEAEDITWSHPSVCLVSYGERHGGGSARAFLGNMLGSGGGGANVAETTTQVVGGVHKSSSKRGILNANGGEYAGRVAITAMASFGGSAVVTGGIDGSVFLAHTLNFGGDKRDYESSCLTSPNSATCHSPLHSDSRLVNGVQLNWGVGGANNKVVGDTIDRGSGETSTGSVTCIAASKGSGYKFGDKASSNKLSGSGDDICPDEEEITSSMDGCWIIAGSTRGSLRVWSLQDVYRSSCCMTRHSRDSGLASNASSPSHLNRSHHGSGATSVQLSSTDDFGMQDAVAGIPVGGHRGGVTCIDLPPRMYRPDALVSGGEDGLIKLWSLKSPSSSGNSGDDHQQDGVRRFFASTTAHRQITSSNFTDFDKSETQGVLTGHAGKILCVKTAWHGDKLLSGGADKTVRLWDLAGTTSSGGKPLTTLHGHQGGVTQTHFWGPNTIVSASTDRSIHLWDTRISGSSPLFALRFHLSPVSDLLLGNRSEPLMVSAGADGSLATWDFRLLSSTGKGMAAESSADIEGDKLQSSSSRTIRSPMARMNHIDAQLTTSSSMKDCGSVKLARSVGRDDFSFFSVSDDGIVNEWEATTGTKLSKYDSGHRDAISGFATFSSADGLLRQGKSGSGGKAVSSVGGTITCSWDGTVRLRKLSRKSSARG